MTTYTNAQSRPHHRPHPLSPPVPDWSKLSRGDAVTARHKDGRVITGRIEMMAIDRSVFWVIQDHGLGRTMVYAADMPLVHIRRP
ncbi:hypothetical protein [Arthrobacter sp. OAP107]|uniref:hypothetical protein n=1 Tax=Arthrobacter sp. OAP107 TaxID=3156445 RepID=UPI003397F360